VFVHIRQISVVVDKYSGNFRGRKLSRNGEKYDFRGESFCGLLAFAAPYHVSNEDQVE